MVCPSYRDATALQFFICYWEKFLKLIDFITQPYFLITFAFIFIFKATVMQIEKALAYVFQKYPANFAFQLFIILQ